MPSNLGRSLLVFALMVVAVLSWHWIDDRGVQPLSQNTPIEMAERQSDYYLEDFEIINVANAPRTVSERKTNESGQASRTANNGNSTGRHLQITGRTLSHHFIDGYSTIELPRVNLRSAANGQWQAFATTGIVSANFDVLDLQGDVQLTHNRTTDAAPVTVNTNSITIDTGNRIISSEENVQVNSTGWHYSANTMRAEIDRGTLSFTSGVEAQFANPN